MLTAFKPDFQFRRQNAQLLVDLNNTLKEKEKQTVAAETRCLLNLQISAIVQVLSVRELRLVCLCTVKIFKLSAVFCNVDRTMLSNNMKNFICQYFEILCEIGTFQYIPVF